VACRLVRWPWSPWSESSAAGWRWPAGRCGGPGVPGVNRARPPQRVLASVDHLGLTPAHERRVQAIQGLRHTAEACSRPPDSTPPLQQRR